MRRRNAPGSSITSARDEKLNGSDARFAKIALPFTIAEFGGWKRAYPEIIEGVWKQRIQSVK